MRSQKKTGRPMAWLMAAGMVLAALPAALSMAHELAPNLQGITSKLALFSAGLSMPEGSLTLLEKRFAGSLTEEESSSSKSAPSPPPPQSSSSSPQREDGDNTPPEIDLEHRGTLQEQDMSTNLDSSAHFIGAGYLRNYTQLSLERIDKELSKPLTLKPEMDGSPQVLILHTHATEAFEPYDSPYFDTRDTWRSTDNHCNMVAVGDEITRVLEENGIAVLHDDTQHDYPSYNGAYERSAQTVKAYLKKYPSIKVVLDLHRDAIIKADDLVIKPVTEINGKKAAQLMIATGCDDGTMNIPNWPDNLRFAAALTNAIEEDYPTLIRPIFFAYRKYNMDLTTGSILLEIGSNGNTLEEAVYTANLVGHSLARLLHQLAGE